MDQNRVIGAGDAELLNTYAGARPLFRLALVVGIGGIVVYGLQARSIGEFVSVVTVGVLTGGAAQLIGGLIGFLFGIPRSLQGEGATAPRESRREEQDSDPSLLYQPNTNLEQISDWLTKILVGVGLTQLANAPAALRDSAQYVAAGLGNFSGSQVFASSILVYFLLYGFFVGYLWARLRLTTLFVAADWLARERNRIKREAQQEVISKVATVAEANALARPGQLDKGRLGIWVDDNPRQNENEKRLLESVLGLRFEISTSTDEALQALREADGKYSIIISDMARPGDSRAGYTLLKRLKENGVNMPLVIYTSSGLQRHDEEARRQGALGSTNDPVKLLELVSKALQGQPQEPR